MNYYLQLAILLFVYMNIGFILSILIKRNDIADVVWGLGFVLLTWTAMFLAEAFEFQNYLISILVSIWGLRLSWHIYWRNHKKAEDFRYKQWRIEWGKWFYLRSWFQVYMLQGFLLFLIALPVSIYQNSLLESNSWFTGIGIIIWIIGFYFEAMSDYQLSEFKKHPENKGKIMRKGLWKYSRHPNYFGEVVLWWGIYLFCLSSIDVWPSVAGPLIITYLIVFVSGIPMLEKKYAGRADFEEYRKATSIFFPFP
jgi:steroid 5-alpha reductase family enzyme